MTLKITPGSIVKTPEGSEATINYIDAVMAFDDAQGYRTYGPVEVLERRPMEYPPPYIEHAFSQIKLFAYNYIIVAMERGSYMPYFASRTKFDLLTELEKAILPIDKARALAVVRDTFASYSECWESMFGDWESFECV